MRKLSRDEFRLDDKARGKSGIKEEGFRARLRHLSIAKVSLDLAPS